MEDYEKKYKEALSRAATELETCGADKSLRNMIYAIFPDELKESEDERIKRNIIAALKGVGYYDCDLTDECIAWLEKQGTPAKLSEEEQNRFAKGVLTSCALSFINYLDAHSYEGKMCVSNLECEDIENAFHNAMWDRLHRYYCKYIEKQGEQKPDDKVEPKFHKGEWIVWKNKCYKVNYNGCGYELIDQNGLSTWLEYGTVDTSTRLYDVAKDAKDGDVVVDKSDGTIGIFESIGHHPDGGSFNDPSYCFLHCRYDDGYFFADFEDGNMMTSDDVIPATKEQRDTLEKAMADAGYTFDFEKKELKKIEQNPTWSEEDENYLQSAENACEYQYGKNTSTILWLKSLKDRVQPQPKQEWSEEDEKIALSIEQVMNCASLLNLVPEKIEKVRAWLKSIKERVQPQQNPTWSDEDEENLQHCCMAISVDSLHTHEDKQDMEAWLKRLKNRIGG